MFESSNFNQHWSDLRLPVLPCSVSSNNQTSCWLIFPVQFLAFFPPVSCSTIPSQPLVANCSTSQSTTRGHWSTSSSHKQKEDFLTETHYQVIALLRVGLAIARPQCLDLKGATPLSPSMCRTSQAICK